MLYDQPLVDTSSGRASAEPGPRLFCKVQTNFSHLLRLAVYRRTESIPVTTMRSVSLGTEVSNVTATLSPEEVYDLLEMVAGAANAVLMETMAQSASFTPRIEEMLSRRAQVATMLLTPAGSPGYAEDSE